MIIDNKYINIKTEIPHKEDLKLIKELNKVSPISTHKYQLPIVWDRAKDFIVWDRHGNSFIDFTSGIFVANSGHSNTDIFNNIRKRLNKDLIFSYTFPNEVRLKFLNKLTWFTNFDKAFLLSSGTEAVEAACKIMKLWGLKKNKKKKTIYSIQGSMHGKTMLAEQLKNNGTWTGINTEVINLQYPKDTDLFLSPLDGNNVCGIILESYRGWDAKFLPISYVKSLVKWARENKVLVCFDEIQAGFGRTGKLFAYEWYKIAKPDLVCCGKGLGGGVPISCVLGDKQLLDIPNDLSSTYSGNPLVCSAALANIQYIKTYNLIKRSLNLGQILNKRLSEISLKYNIITGYNSKGLVGALLIANELLAETIVYKTMKKGLLLINTGKESIKMGPPLTISREGLVQGLNILEEAIKEVSNKPKFKNP